jgi:hypothetical protein
MVELCLLKETGYYKLGSGFLYNLIILSSRLESATATNETTNVTTSEYGCRQS